MGVIITVISPLGGLFWGMAALLGAVGTTKPPANVWMVVGVEMAEVLLYFVLVLHTDNSRLRSVPVVSRPGSDSDGLGRTTFGRNSSSVQAGFGGMGSFQHSSDYGPLVDDAEMPQDPDEEDVIAERKEVVGILSTADAYPPIMSVSLRKVYRKGLRTLFEVLTGGKDSRNTMAAVHDLTFRVEKGECFGLLGPNGAGKSTTIEMCVPARRGAISDASHDTRRPLSLHHHTHITPLRHHHTCRYTRATLPTSGGSYVAGHSLQENPLRAFQNMGVVHQTDTLWGRLSVESHLLLACRVRGWEDKTGRAMVKVLLRCMQMSTDGMQLKPAASLSGGMKRKLCTAISLIGNPSVVFLDEPSAGLDPLARRSLWDLLRETMSNRSVILTTHRSVIVSSKCCSLSPPLPPSFPRSYTYTLPRCTLILTTTASPLLC